MIGECRIGCVFLCVTLVSAVAVQVVGAGQRSFPGECSRPWVVVNEDLNSTIAVELSDAALNRTGLREHFRKHIRAKNLTHYFVNPQAMLAGYDTKVSEPIWTEHPGLAAAPKWVAKMKKLHDDERFALALGSGKPRARDALHGLLLVRGHDLVVAALLAARQDCRFVVHLTPFPSRGSRGCARSCRTSTGAS